MKSYKNKDEVERDLKRLSLERQIAWEELKGLRYDVREDFQPYNWLNTAFSAIKKYGLLYLVRKYFK